jgi:hypothetical protein
VAHHHAPAEHLRLLTQQLLLLLLLLQCQQGLSPHLQATANQLASQQPSQQQHPELL